MGYQPKTKIEKFIFWISGLSNNALSKTLPKEEMTAVANFWLTRSTNCTVFSTICLTSFIVLFVETKIWYFYLPFIMASLFFGIKAWCYEKCAHEILKLWT